VKVETPTPARAFLQKAGGPCECASTQPDDDGMVLVSLTIDRVDHDVVHAAFGSVKDA
jgi:hypothetical protein